MHWRNNDNRFAGRVPIDMTRRPAARTSAALLPQLCFRPATDQRCIILLVTAAVRNAGCMNRLELIGIVVWPVEVRCEQVTRRPFARAMLAVSRGVDGMDFVPLTLWDREAEDAAHFVGEGSLIAVEGHLRSTLLSGPDTHGGRGARRVLSVVADRVVYLRLRAPRAGSGR